MYSRFKNHLERGTNTMYGDIIEELYGNGSKIKVSVLDYSTSTKRPFAHITLYMGIITEETVSSTDLIELFVNDAWGYIEPNKKLDVIISVDVL
jgi:hypothetical protein